jgi:hypothetical protein
VTSRQFATGCGVVVVVVLLLAGCGIAAAVGRLPAGEHPSVDFRSEEISAAREAVVPELEAQLDGMEGRFDATRIGDRVRVDRCEKGFDDFTRTDQYAYACRMALVELVPVREPFRQEASRLGEALLDGACPDGTDTDRALAEPFDSPRQLDSSRGDCTPGSSVSGPEIRDWLTVPPEPGEVELAEDLLRPSCFREFCEVGPLDFAAAVDAAPPGTAALAVVQAQETYYLVAWECPWPASWFRDVCTNDDRALPYRPRS